MGIRILLADDHKIIREGLRSLIEQQAGMDVVAEADNGRIAVQQARELQPNVVIMDITLPELNGIEATRQIKQNDPGVKVIALSVHSDRRFVSGILDAGASGYLLKDCAFEELVAAVRAVMAGRNYLDSRTTSVVIQDYVRRLSEAEDSSDLKLTAREKEVLQLLAEGKSTKQIASRLHLSIKTIETPRRNIMDKLKINSIAELTKYAVREGLTSL